MEDDKLELLGTDLKASILDDQLANKISIGIEVAGIITDCIAQIPIIDTINKIKNSIDKRNALRLQQKLATFLFGVREIPVIDRIRFMEELDSLTALREKSGDILLDIIVRINHLGKIDILVNLFKANVAGKTDIEEFLRLTMILEKVSIVDLHALKKYNLETYSNIPGRYDGSLTDSLNSAGLLNTCAIGGDGGTLYNLNTLGKQMLLHGLNEI